MTFKVQGVLRHLLKNKHEKKLKLSGMTMEENSNLKSSNFF
jgi:hypothetical protein